MSSPPSDIDFSQQSVFEAVGELHPVACPPDTDTRPGHLRELQRAALDRAAGCTTSGRLSPGQFRAELAAVDPAASPTCVDDLVRWGFEVFAAADPPPETTLPPTKFWLQLRHTAEVNDAALSYEAARLGLRKHVEEPGAVPTSAWLERRLIMGWEAATWHEGAGGRELPRERLQRLSAEVAELEAEIMVASGVAADMAGGGALAGAASAGHVGNEGGAGGEEVSAILFELAALKQRLQEMPAAATAAAMPAAAHAGPIAAEDAGHPNATTVVVAAAAAAAAGTTTTPASHLPPDGRFRGPPRSVLASLGPQSTSPPLGSAADARLAAVEQQLSWLEAGGGQQLEQQLGALAARMQQAAGSRQLGVPESAISDARRELALEDEATLRRLEMLLHRASDLDDLILALPALLDRLRLVHSAQAEAREFAARLSALEATQSGLSETIRAHGSVEASLRDGIRSNAEMMAARVQSLQQRAEVVCAKLERQGMVRSR